MPRTKVQVPCTATMVSTAIEGHTHTCMGDHCNGDHFCPECRYWWYDSRSK